MEVSIYKFVTWDVPELETLKESKIYKVAEKLNNNKPLLREEKDWLATQLIHNTFGNWNVSLQGWCFDFRNACKNYIVKQHDTWQEYYALDKTSLRKAIYGHIDKIVEVA